MCHSETSDKESFSRFAKFYKIEGEILEAKRTLVSHALKSLKSAIFDAIEIMKIV